MAIRFLILGSPNERDALMRSVRAALDGRTVAFDEHLRLSSAIRAFDQHEPPRFVIATPSVILDQGLDLLRHVRSGGWTGTFCLWRREVPGLETIASLRHYSGVSFTDKSPLPVTAEVARQLAAATASSSRPVVASPRA